MRVSSTSDGAVFELAAGELAGRFVHGEYIAKPFSPVELVARIKAVLRRGDGSSRRDTLEFDGLTVDMATRKVTVRGEVVPTTTKEFALLAFLASSPDRVFTRAQLLDKVWGSSSDWQHASTVTEHVRRIRHLIEEDATRPRWIRTVRGVGYIFEPRAPAGFKV